LKNILLFEMIYPKLMNHPFVFNLEMGLFLKKRQ